MIEVHYTPEYGFEEVDDLHSATHRVDEEKYGEYRALREETASTEDELLETAITPTHVTPEQYNVLKDAVADNVWLVPALNFPIPTAVTPLVYDPAPEAPAALQPQVVDAEDDVETPEPQAVQEAPGIPKRPPIGRCDQRRGLPHLAQTYVKTQVASVYFPGRTRVDGICQCGLRIADIRCPHQGQQPGVNPPTCAWCSQVLVSQAGFIENGRQTANHGIQPDPRVALPVPIGFSGGEDQSIIRDAYRQPGA